MVWDAVRHVCHEGPAWGWVQAYTRQRDRRSTYLALKAHYMGSTIQARLRSKVDQMLETMFYDGTKRQFIFEKFAETLQMAFIDLQSTQEEVSEERKVHALLNRISDPRLEVAKNQVIASDHLQSKFEVANNFLKRALDSKVSYSAVNCKSRISTVTAGRGRGSIDGRGHVGGRGGLGFGRGRGTRKNLA